MTRLERLEERNREIVLLYNAGVKLYPIASHFRIYVPKVKKILAEQGIEVGADAKPAPKEKRPKPIRKELYGHLVAPLTLENGYDPANNYPLANVKIHTEDVGAYRLGYPILRDHKWNQTGGYDTKSTHQPKARVK